MSPTTRNAGAASQQPRKSSSTSKKPQPAPDSSVNVIPPFYSRQAPQFPPHNGPRVWFLTAGNSPISIALIRHLLAHGDYVVSGVNPSDWSARRTAYSAAAAASSSYDATDAAATHDQDRFRALLEDVRVRPGWQEHFKLAEFDPHIASSVSAGLAEAARGFGRLDILVVNVGGPTVVGAVEELTRAPGAVRAQFEATFTGPVNVIRGALPHMRDRGTGHIILVGGVTGHLGTPGLGAYCASQWAIEGYCDSLAYEVAPFGVRISILQANLEVGVLTNKITMVPEMLEYTREGGNEAPLARGLIGGLVTRLKTSYTGEKPTQRTRHGKQPSKDQKDRDAVQYIYPVLPAEFEDRLIAETVNALLAIGGAENPPARHIIGHEGVASVKEKLKTVSEELEEFVEVSGSVDF